MPLSIKRRIDIITKGSLGELRAQYLRSQCLSRRPDRSMTCRSPRMRAMLALTGAACLGILAACDGTESASAQAPEPAPAQAASPWNEIPLTAGTFREYETGFRTDTIDIPLAVGGALEYKLALEEGDSIVYEWAAVEMTDPELLWAEFHGHTERVGDAPGDLMFYRKAEGGSERGALVAPFTGIHGWYFENRSDEPIVIRLHVAGFHELVEQ